MQIKRTANRFHDFSAGHRVHGHESKCADLHGHNYRVHFTCSADKLDAVGRVIDFGDINKILCQWLESNWDHKFLLWDEDDSLFAEVLLYNNPGITKKLGVILVPFNPTAENMASYLLDLGNTLLKPRGIKLIRVVVEETRKCYADATILEDSDVRKQHTSKATKRTRRVPSSLDIPDNPGGRTVRRSTRPLRKV